MTATDSGASAPAASASAGGASTPGANASPGSVSAPGTPDTWTWVWNWTGACVDAPTVAPRAGWNWVWNWTCSDNAQPATASPPAAGPPGRDGPVVYDLTPVTVVDAPAAPARPADPGRAGEHPARQVVHRGHGRRPSAGCTGGGRSS